MTNNPAPGSQIPERPAHWIYSIPNNRPAEPVPPLVAQALAPEAPSRIHRTVTVGEVTSSV